MKDSRMFERSFLIIAVAVALFGIWFTYDQNQNQRALKDYECLSSLANEVGINQAEADAAVKEYQKYNNFSTLSPTFSDSAFNNAISEGCINLVTESKAENLYAAYTFEQRANYTANTVSVQSNNSSLNSQLYTQLLWADALFERLGSNANSYVAEGTIKSSIWSSPEFYVIFAVTIIVTMIEVKFIYSDIKASRSIRLKIKK